MGKIFIAVAVMNGGCCTGRLTVGYVSDFAGRLNTAIFAMVTASLACFLIFPFIGSSTAKLYAAVFLWGASGGSIMSMMTVLVKQISGEENFGMFYGLNSAMIGIGALVGIPTCDKMLESVASNTDLLLVCFGGFCLLAISFMLVGRYAKQEYTWKWMDQI
ncbi:Fc.00g022770.m01.CDS01 [Cosmosporella sp. VM-42]